jgi:hypothetical protein
MSDKDRIVAKAMTDKKFLEELKKSPKTVLERELGRKVGVGKTIVVVEDTELIVHLVVPRAVGGPQELKDGDLGKIAGGASSTSLVIQGCFDCSSDTSRTTPCFS